MKTKLEMAHEYLLRFIGTTVADAWQYADAMQAEADKRKKEEQSEYVFEAIEEWKPDWSQAPEWANCWQKSPPDYKQFDYFWFCEVFKDGKAVGNKKEEAPSFGYTGNWRNSLRKRPQ